MKATQQLQRARTESLARQHHPRPARQRHAQALHRRAVRHRPDLQPHHLRPRHYAQQFATTRKFANSWGAAFADEALFFELAIEDLDARRRLVRADSRAHRRRRRVGVARSVAAAGLRRQSDRGRGQDAVTKRPTAPICSSRFPAPRRARRRSKRRSSPVYRST